MLFSWDLGALEPEKPRDRIKIAQTGRREVFVLLDFGALGPENPADLIKIRASGLAG
ncbi:hypothetical protein GCM10020358_08270 [Amorphoplanes nipponensis]|uniref:Uncharacterized protein n=1 Tax=Actinoplanes nipponensis TaxID=135950 RepID=A0A919JF30_9ACTN|nr:hypothetical protein Ani05nite_15500 [Actinoplanes nipponensis]